MTAIGPADDHHRKLVLSLTEQGTQIKFNCRPTVLGKTCPDSVAEDKKRTFHPAKMNQHSSFFPSVWKLKTNPVNPGRVIFRDFRRLVRERHLHIGVVRPVMTLHGPVSWNFDAVPVRVIQFFGNHLAVQNGWLWKKLELPGPIQKLEQRRSLWISFQSLGFILIGMEVSPWRQICDTRAFRIEPGNVRSRMKEIRTLHHE